MMTPDEILRQADEQIASRKSANKPAATSGAQSDDGWRDPWSEAPTPRGFTPASRADDQTQQQSSDGFGARLKQGVGRAFDSAQVALSGDEGVIAKVAADQQRNALPQTALQRQMAEEIAPYNEAAKNAEGFADSARAWGSLGLKRAGQLLSNPAEAGKMIVEQLPNSIPGLAGGFAGAKAGAALGTAVAPGLGTAVGAAVGGLAGGFAGGYGLEKGAAVLEQVQEKAHQQGIDLQDQNAARGFVAKSLAEIDAAATRKAVGTAGADAALNVLTMGAAGLSGRGIVNEARALAKAVDDGVVSAADATAALARLEAANAARNTVGQKALRGGAVVGTEMAGEGVSEAVGQKYAYGEVDPGQVIDEALLGLGQGGAMALGGKAFRKAAGLPDNDDAATRSLDGVHSALAKNAGLQQDGAPNDGDSGGGGVDAQAGNPAFDSTNAPAPFINQGVMDVNGLGPRPPAPVLDTQRLDALLEPQRPSEAMGLRTGPDAGPLENAAALSVDTGATAQMQGSAGIVANDLQSEPQAANAMQAVNLDEVADPYERAMLQRLYDDHFADGDLESVISANAELDTSFDFGANVNQLLANAGATPQEIEDAQRGQASAQAADRPGQAQENDRSNFDAELSVAKNEGDGSGRLAGAEQGEASQQPVAQQAAAPGSQAEGANVATLAQLNRKKLAEMTDDELQQLSSLLPADHSRQQKIQKAIQTRAAQAQAAINEGVKADGTQTDQAQQAVAQPAQAGAAQAGQPAGQITPNAAPNAGVEQAQAAPGSKYPPTDIRIGDKVVVDGEIYTVTAPIKQGRKSVGIVADRDSDTNPLAGVKQVLLKGDEAIAARLAALGQQPAQAAPDQRAKRIDEAGAQWTRMPAVQRSALAQRLDGVKPVLAKNLPRAEWGNLNADIQRKLADAMGTTPARDSRANNPENKFQSAPEWWTGRSEDERRLLISVTNRLSGNAFANATTEWDSLSSEQKAFLAKEYDKYVSGDASVGSKAIAKVIVSNGGKSSAPKPNQPPTQAQQVPAATNQPPANLQEGNDAAQGQPPASTKPESEIKKGDARALFSGKAMDRTRKAVPADARAMEQFIADGKEAEFQRLLSIRQTGRDNLTDEETSQFYDLRTERNQAKAAVENAGRSQIKSKQPAATETAAPTAQQQTDAQGNDAESVTPEAGPFGPIFDGFENNPEGAIAKLMQEKRGEVPDAFTHPELGSIAFIYGDEGMGLRHIEAKRGIQWVHRIPAILRNGRLERDPKLPRAYLVQDGDPAGVAVIRLDWDGEQKTWLVTAHQDDKGKWSGVGKTSRTADNESGLVQGNPSQSSPQGDSATTSKAKQPITRADVEAAQQQAAASIGARIDAMSAGDVNKIAKKFLPTMGMKPTMSKANNKAAMTDAKINLMAAAAEVGAVLPAEVTRALQADMEGHVVDVGDKNPATTNEQADERQSLEQQLQAVNDELLNQGATKNANTRKKRDQIREAIANRDFPEILKAVDGNVGVAEEIHLGLQYRGNEPKQKTIERILKKHGITDEYRARWVERLMDGQNDEMDAEMQSYEDKASASQVQAVEAQVVNVPPSVDAAMTADMKKQQDRVKRLRTAAAADGMTLDEKKAAQLKVTAAEATLRTMRTQRFDAEDAAVKAVADKSMEPFAEFADLFPGAADALQALVPEIAPAAKAKPTKKPADYGASNKLVSQSRADELRAKLREKAKKNLFGGLDTEMMAWGTELAVFHLEAGVRKFSDLVAAMASDLGTTPAKLKPYLRSWYNGARDMMEDHGLSIEGMDSPETVRAELAKIGAEAAPDSEAKTSAPSLSDSLLSDIRAGNMPKDNPALKKLVEAFDGKPADQARMKEAQEQLETAIVTASREVVAKGDSDKATFDALLRLYESQPNLNVRTSTSIANQAYSTPAPLAFLASQLAGITKQTLTHEPTAGTGMLLIGADPKNSVVNELNDLRVSLLEQQGFTPTQKDAAIAPLRDKRGPVDAVITNPPFGSVKDENGKATKVKVDGYNLGQIDHLIAARALETMKDDGRAVLILGANKAPGGLSTDDRIFFNWLYSHYNVVGHFEVAGDLYIRQGAGWPVRVIAIAGREKSSRISPVAGTIERVDNWSQVYDQYKQLLDSSGRPVRSAGAAAGRPIEGQAQPADVPNSASTQAAKSDRPGRAESAGSDGNVAGTRAGTVSDLTGATTDPVGHEPDEQRINAQSFVPPRLDEAGQSAKPEPAQRSAKPAGASAVADAPAEAGNEFQSQYIPRSARKDEGVLIPANMAQPTQDALNHLEDQVGDIDEFARKELGYESTEALHNALMGLQVDSVATAIHQIKQGKAVVIADQTGIGKGRQAAAIIRWAARSGMTPVFVSVKPSLFTDMYGDLADIGTHDVEPFILNSDAWVSGQDGEKLFANKASSHRAAIEAIANNGALPAGRNALFMTYSQINTDNAQRRALRALAGNAVFVLDESHNAAGASGTGDFMISVLKEAKGVTYLSATYAKRPDNMPLYFKTDIGDAAADSEGLAAAMSAGGLPLQTVVSNNLVKAGQMFRRERSYDGVSIASTFDRKNRALHEEMSDTATQALRAIVRADRLFHEIYVKQLQKQLKQEGGDIKDIAGNQASAGVQHTEFSSVVHNFVRQMLLGLKAQTAADEAIASLKRGEKPIIAVENTMGSFLSEYASSNGLTQGDSLGSFDYRTVLSRALERSRALVETLPTGEEVRKTISLAQLDPVTRKAYDQAQEVIDGLKISIPVSPIDWMRAEIERAGFSVAEITGRNLAVDYSNKGKPVLSAIEQAEQRDKVATTRRFNGGELDALILNVAGSTGISLHASEKFQDQRQRHMIVAQAAGDINIFMQMLGRIHRTGQVRLPKYTILSVDLPTEKRPTAVLSKKMKSLNANTSSNTESATSVKTADILNKYGDQIVHQYLQDNMELARQLDVDDLVGGDTPAEDIARKATGRLALQPIEVQNAFYEDVEAQYDALIEYLNKTNQNDLAPRTFDFDAKETRSEVLFDGPNKETPFGADAIYGEYSIKAQGTPMKPDEIKAAIESNLGGKTGAEHADALTDQMLQTYAEQFNQAREKAGTTPDTFAIDKYTALMKSAFGDVGVSMAEEAQALIAKGIPLPPMTPRDMMRAQGVGAGMDFIKSHAIGRTFRVDINSEPFNAVVTNVRNTHKATGNPFSMSKLQLTVSVNGALRSITVPATQFKKIEVSSIAPTFRVEQLFKEQPPNQRETAKIITGNLLAAYGELKGVKGTIISFTTADGGTEQGILLPKLFDYSKNTQGDYRLRSGADALNFLQRSENKDIGRFGIATRDGQVRVLPYGDGVQVRVPRSKAQGARYFLDKNLIAIAGDFVSTANAMTAKVENADDAVKLLDLLMDKQALYALPSMAEEAKALALKDAPTDDTANFASNPARRPGTAQDKAVMRAIADGKSARDVLRLIASGSKDPFLRQVARLLLKAGITPNIQFGYIGKTAKGDPIHGQYRGKSDTIAIAGSAEYAAERIFMHEAMHAATMRALKKGGLVRVQLQKLLEHVRKQPGAAGFYGTKNVDEFVVEVFTNPDFQAALRGMSAPTGSPLKSAWHSFVQVLRRILGLGDNSISVLSQALELGVAAVRQDMVLRRQGARASGRANAGTDAIDQTQTAAFKRWFGDWEATKWDGASVVREPAVSSRSTPQDMPPKVVYHGTRKDFASFAPVREGNVVTMFGDEDTVVRRGIFFAENPEFAATFAAQSGEGSPQVMPVYLNIRNPMFLEDGFTSEYIDELAAAGFDDAERLRHRKPEMVWAEFDDEVGEQFVAAAKAAGYDGVYMREQGRGLDGEEDQFVWVAFDPEQVKSSTGNNGNFDPEDADILNFGADDVQRNISNGIKAVTAMDVKQLGRHKLTDWLKLGLQFLGRRQLVDVYGDLIPQMRDYDRLAEQMEADKNESGAEADELVRRWAKLPDEGKLADLMHEATLAQVDADSDVEYVAGDDKAQSAILKNRFKALSPEAQAVYREARDGYKAHHEKVRKAIRERIERSELSSPKRHELLAKMDDDFFQKVKGVYFPLARFGRYVTAVKDGTGQVVSVSRAETMPEAESARVALLKAFPAEKGFSVGRVTLDKEFVASHKMVGRGFMTDLYRSLEGVGLPTDQLAELEDTLGQLYLSSLPDLSWAKHGIHRKGTPGFSQDARRAFAQNMFHGARYLAKLRYSDVMQDSLDAMQEHVDEWGAVTDEFDQPRAQRVVDEMLKRHDAMMNPKSNPLSTALTSFGFLYYLGLSPAAAMVNLSQTALVAYPVMAGKWGYKKSAAALLRASKESVAGKNNIRTQLTDKDEIAAYEQAVKAGVIDVTMVHDLAGISQGEDQKVSWALRPVMRMASYMFHQAELFNRQSTFIAAFRLAREAGSAPADAYEQAVKATYDGHFDYGAANRPRVMQGNVARVVLLFKQFGQNMIYTMARQAYQSVAGKSPEERRQARKVFAGLMTTHAMAAGVLGLPLVKPLLAAASMLGSDDDEPWDAEVALRNMLAEAVGQKPAEVLAKGVSRLTPWDVSGRVGLDNLIFPDVREGLEGQRWAETFATGMLGPVMGIGTNAARAAQKIGDGDYGRALEDLLPIAARNPIKAARYWFEGAQDRSGVAIKDEVSAAGSLGQAVGFSPSEVRLAQEGKTAVLDADRRLSERRSELLSQFAKAAMGKDEEGMTKANDAIVRFNERNPGMRITAPQKWQSVRRREQRIRDSDNGIYLPSKRRDAMQAGAFAFE